MKGESQGSSLTTPVKLVRQSPKRQGGDVGHTSAVIGDVVGCVAGDGVVGFLIDGIHDRFLCKRQWIRKDLVETRGIYREGTKGQEKQPESGF